MLKFPYPYQAAFTVASDIDSASIARFRGIHALFCRPELIKKNSPEWQALGLTTDCSRFDRDRGGVPGLGLELSDSFFLVGDATTFGMYRPAPEQGGFREDEQDGENCAGLIRRWLKEGQIDSFHTFLHYQREEVLPLLKEFYSWCERENVSKPCVWINHSTPVAPTGLCPRGRQPNRVTRLARLSALKVFGPLCDRRPRPLRYALARYYGDKPGSPYYTNDFLAANGLRYIWLNTGSDGASQIALRETRQNGRPTILSPVTMDDGVRYYQFARCFGMLSRQTDKTAYLRDSAEGFDASVLISEASLAELCRCNGTCIFYTHWTHFRSVPISNETLNRFELLQRWRDAGRIWVTSTARLLEWTRRRTFLRVVYQQQGNRWLVDIQGVEDPIFGQERLEVKDLNGLCFRTLSAADGVAVALNGRTLGPEDCRRSDNLYWLDAAGPDRPKSVQGTQPGAFHAADGAGVLPT